MATWLRRHGIWLLLTFGMIAYLSWTRPANVAVLQYKGCLLLLSLVVSYWARRFLLAFMRLERGAPRDVVTAAVVIAQALIFEGVAHVMGAL